MVVVLILAPLIVGLGVFAIFAFARKENKRKNEKLNRSDFVVRSTHTWGIIMIALEVILVSLLIFGNLESPFSIGVNIVLSAFVLIFAVGILQNFRENVHVKDKKFIITPMIGKKREYKFSQIEKIDGRKTGYYVYVDGKKVLSLDPSGIGSSLFVEVYNYSKGE